MSITEAEERASARARIDAAFHRYSGRPRSFTSALEYERGRADDASQVLCRLIGILESTACSEYYGPTPARIAEAVELAVGSLFEPTEAGA